MTDNLNLSTRAREAIAISLPAWYLSSLLVVMAAAFAFDHIKLETLHPGSSTRTDLMSSFAAWDGEWYVKIANHGYDWHNERMSSVAFFPAYPLLGNLIKRLTNCRTELALLVVAHAALVGCFVLLVIYVGERFGYQQIDLREYCAVALAIFPTTFWMRMCYTESLFLFVTLLAMLAMQQQWRPIWVAVIIGFATTTRSAGVALIPVFLWWMWNQEANTTTAKWFFKCSALMPVCIWGLLSYMIFLHFSFGDSLVFMQTQIHWTERAISNLSEKLWKLGTLEPFWAVYDSNCQCYWGIVPPRENPWFNMKFLNPVYVLLTVALLAIGAKRRWLNPNELLLALGLLAIPLWFQATRTCMMSQARYASVIFPVYIVIGQLLVRLPGRCYGSPRSKR